MLGLRGLVPEAICIRGAQLATKNANINRDDWVLDHLRTARNTETHVAMT